MPKTKIDTSTVPETLTSPWIKRFFKERYGIPVRVNRATSSGFVSVWIMADRSVGFNLYDHRLVYHHEFPPELGNRCLKLIYPTSEKLCAQNWAGNVQKHSIAMSGGEFRQLFTDLLEANQ